MYLKSGMIRWVAFGGSGLTREVAFGGSGITRGVAFGGSGLTRGEVMYVQLSHVTNTNLERFFVFYFFKSLLRTLT